MTDVVFDHCNIQVQDLDASIGFYCSLLGLTAGPRAPLAAPGAWLYDRDPGRSRAVIHLIIANGTPANRPAEPQGTGPIDHIAFRVADAPAMLDRIAAMGLTTFGTRTDADGRPMRTLLHDPDGVTIELLF